MFKFICVKLDEDDKIVHITKIFDKDITHSIFTEYDLIVKYEHDCLTIVKDRFALYHFDKEKFLSILLSCEMWGE
jgi:hypothetical protein